MSVAKIEKITIVVTNKNSNISFVENNTELITQTVKSPVFTTSNYTKSNTVFKSNDTKFSIRIAFYKSFFDTLNFEKITYFTVKVNISSLVSKISKK